MLKTLKANNGSLAKLGNVQVQPVTEDISYSPKIQSTQTVQNALAPIPASQASLKVATFNVSTGEVKRTSDPTLVGIATSIKTDAAFVLPALQAKLNSVLPSYALQLEPKGFHELGKSTLPTKKFEPYERLTGISHERPEIVMLADFLPLFEHDVSLAGPAFLERIKNSGSDALMTDAGRYVDAQVQIRSLQHANTRQLVQKLRERYPAFKSLISSRFRETDASLLALRDSTTFLFDVIKSLDRIKSQLDVRDVGHVIDPVKIAREHVGSYTAVRSSVQDSYLVDIAKRYMPDQYGLVDVLVRLGYREASVRRQFTSTKIWLQLLIELRDMLHFHSLEFIDADVQRQRSDNNATTVTKNNVKHFGINRTPPDLPSIDSIASAQIVDAAQMIAHINQAWQALYRDVHFKSTNARLAALANLVSKEFRYSWGLGQREVQRSLQEGFGYSVQPTGNLGAIEAIIGEVGNNIADIPGANQGSLTGIAQRQVSPRVAVLTFEPKYVDGVNGTLTPGSEYYVDSVLDTDGRAFNTTQFDELSQQLEQIHRHLSIVTAGMNLLGTKAYDPDDKEKTSYESTVASPRDLIRSIVDPILNQQTGEVQQAFVKDKMVAVYSFAAHDNRVKTILFMYTMMHVMRVYKDSGIDLLPSMFSADNTPTADYLIDRLVTIIKDAVPQTSTGTQLNDAGANNLTVDALKSAIKTMTPITKLVSGFMNQLLLAFRNSHLFVDKRTRYSGYLDTLVMMAAFDMLVQTIDAFGNQTIVASNTGPSTFLQGNFTLVIARSSMNHKGSYGELLTRLTKETALVQQTMYAVLGTLSRLGDSIRGYSNYLQSPSAMSKLQEISAVVNDSTLLRLLFTEQQIMLLASTVHDISSRLSTVERTQSSKALDEELEFKLLDDSVVTPMLRNVLFGAFSGDRFASRKGYNKKVLSVGVPLGFTQRIKQRVVIDNVKNNVTAPKQKDVVKVAVYKIDVENSDVIYRPKRFLFEMSRFPVRDDSQFLDVPDRPTLDDVVSVVPTRDFGLGLRLATDVTYWQVGGATVPRSSKSSFIDNAYSFLSDDQKDELAQNHVMSYLLEVYLRTLMGINVGDHQFDVVDADAQLDADFTKTVVDHVVHDLTTKVKGGTSTSTGPVADGVLFTSTAKHNNLSNAAGIAGSVSVRSQFMAATSPASPAQTREQQAIDGATSQALNSLSSKHVPAMFHSLQNASNLIKMHSTLSNPLVASRRLLRPKQFDRVFNLIIDPDEFEIDYDSTVKTPQGKRALEQLISRGDVQPALENDQTQLRMSAGGRVPAGSRAFVQSRSAPNVNVYRFRDRDKNDGDLSFEKYFVTIETFDED